MPLKCSVKAQVPRAYMFFGTGSPNLKSILKPEEEKWRFSACTVIKSRKTAENALKLQF